MTLEASYRTSILKKEIIDSLFEFKQELSPILIWQNDGGKRNIAMVIIEEIDLGNQSVTLRPLDNSTSVDFSKLKLNHPFYLKAENKSIVFKQEKPAKKTPKGFIQLSIPSEVKMFEKRREKRYTFADRDPMITADIYPGASLDISSKITNVDLVNISLSGMCFYCLKKHARLFYVKDKIKIAKIGCHSFQRSVFAEIKYITNGTGVNDQIQVGIQFAEPITEDILKIIYSS
ncbi:MAG: hypothetical protein WC635_14930 [Bacteriovorax sp.]|jgi:hypothetical protein